jgi:Ca2+-transporting ATPase
MAMTHLWRRGDGHDDVVASKGAPEAVAALCHLSASQKVQVANMAAKMADRGLRVLGVAKAVHRAEMRWPALQHDFSFKWIGLIGLADPLREEVPATVAQCYKAGIRVVMITGDHPRTANAIAIQAGITTAGILTGNEIDAMDRQTLSERITDINVFARIRPDQKLALVELLKSQGEIVAMTGDGINDAPALKAAHIGIAMGQRGTDVAREASALVLLKDDFSSIIEAIKMGRRTFANMRQAMLYTLAVHIPIVGLALLPVLFGLPLILAPLHIAFIELLLNPICSLVFEAEEPEINLMERSPRKLGEPLLPTRKIVESLIYGGIITVAVFGLYAWLLFHAMPAAQASTATFIVLITANAMLILPSRSAQSSWRNLWAVLPGISIWALAASFLALLIITRLSFIAEAFKFGKLSHLEWLTYFGIGVSMLLVLQIAKMMMGRPVINAPVSS